MADKSSLPDIGGLGESVLSAAAWYAEQRPDDVEFMVRLYARCSQTSSTSKIEGAARIAERVDQGRLVDTVVALLTAGDLDGLAGLDLVGASAAGPVLRVFGENPDLWEKWKTLPKDSNRREAPLSVTLRRFCYSHPGAWWDQRHLFGDDSPFWWIFRASLKPGHLMTLDVDSPHVIAQIKTEQPDLLKPTYRMFEHLISDHAGFFVNNSVTMGHEVLWVMKDEMVDRAARHPEIFESVQAWFVRMFTTNPGNGGSVRHDPAMLAASIRDRAGLDPDEWPIVPVRLFAEMNPKMRDVRQRVMTLYGGSNLAAAGDCWPVLMVIDNENLLREAASSGNLPETYGVLSNPDARRYAKLVPEGMDDSLIGGILNKIFVDQMCT